MPALVAGALALPATASPEGSALALPRPGGLAVSVRPDGVVSHRSPADVLGAARRLGDPGVLLRSLADAAVAAGQPQPLVVPAEETQQEAVVDATFAAAVPGGDLDGDGKADVLTYSSGDDGLLLRALRGTDGSPLWSLPMEASTGALAFPLGRDLTGDGADDLLLDEFTLDGEETVRETPATYEYGFNGTIRRGYGVVSGRLGEVAWSKASTGTIEETFAARGAGPAVDVEYRLTSTNLAVLALLSDDLTGDGGPDLAISEIDLDVAERGTGAGAGPASVARGTATLRSSTRAAVVAGVDGTSSAARTAQARSGISLLIPVGQVLGSPAAELAWLTDDLPSVDVVCTEAVVAPDCLDRSTGTAQVRVELLQDGTGTSAWTTTAPGGLGFVQPAGADLDADGVADLSLSLVDEQGGRLAMLSGADGAQLWDARSDTFPPDLVDVVPARAGLTAVVASVPFEAGPDGSFGASVVVERRAAATGAVLGTDRQEVPVPQVDGGAGGSGTFVFLGYGPTPDGDGDGAGELGVYSLAVAAAFDEQGEMTDRAEASSASFSDLASGRVLLAERSEDLRVLFAVGDLDGDGLVDLQRDVLGERFEDSSATGLRLVDGRELWSVAGESPIAAGDQDGSAGEELLVLRGDDDGPLVVSLSGADLRERWRAPVG